ncbi:MAG: isoprenyl transferase [Bacteroidales bacterium]|nr:isoprenyl transferase [Bacteroidales bacterium]
MLFRDQIVPERLPRHVAVIMDGNGRWATSRGLERQAGHIEGAKTVRRITEASVEAGIRYLTLYAFSIENWNRPQDEVNALMSLLVKSLQEETGLLMQHGIRLRVIGDTDSLSPDVRRELEETLRLTEANTRMDMILALSYGARWELTRAAKRMAQAVREGQLAADDITEARFGDYLCTAGIPDPDLLIRTSGELRISNFLLWQIAYSELYFTPVLWPDFTKEMFFEAIVNYQQRQRRFGKTASQVAGEGEGAAQ